MLDSLLQLLNYGLEHPLWLSIIIILGTFLMEDPVTIIVGSLIAEGKVTFWEGIIPLFIGIFLGDLGLYLGGKFFKNRFPKLKDIKLNSFSLIFWARFIPGMRVTTYPAAGYFGVNIFTFCLINFASSIVWTAFIVKGSMLFSDFIPESLLPYKWPILICLIIVIIILEARVRKVVTSKKSKNLSKT